MCFPFPAEQNKFEKHEGSNAGDIVISVEQAARQAKENKLTLDNEIAQLILHGLITFAATITRLIMAR